MDKWWMDGGWMDDEWMRVWMLGGYRLAGG